jgi:hypothetical protein
VYGPLELHAVEDGQEPAANEGHDEEGGQHRGQQVGAVEAVPQVLDLLDEG